MMDDRQCQIEFGNFIRGGRERLRLYQTQVAEQVGITQQYYSQIETGARNVDFVLALKICNILKLSVNDFFKAYIK